MKRRIFFPAVALLIVMTIVISLKFGAVTSSWHELYQSIFDFNRESQVQQLVRTLRIPRTLGALFVGASLAAAGALMQGITSNPIADSGLLGINAGAGLGLALVFVMMPAPTPTVAILGSFLGAFIAIVIIYFASSTPSIGMSPIRIILLGAAISAFFTSLSQSISLIFNLNQDITFWLVGGASNISWEQIKLTLPIMFLGLVGTFFIGPQITLLSMGDEAAVALGRNPQKIRKWTMFLVLLLAGTSVSLVGTVSFVGLIVPHVVRYFVGYDYRILLPASILAGGLFFVVADCASRFVAQPTETPVGVIITIIGVPFLLLQIRRGSL